ncbi:MAG: alpha/beta hydrolase, partial [Microbacterium sp.]
MTEKTQGRTVITKVVGSGDDAITYDIHAGPETTAADQPALFLFGAPMDATGLQMLADRFPDRTVITYDPRGAGRNPVGTADITAELHADDLHRVISDADLGAVDAFGSSGGAVTLLALAAAHPADLRRIIAHEPPLAAGLSDRDTVLEAVADMKDTYAREGDGAAMAKFMALVMFDGVLPADFLDGPAPDPAAFGMSADDDGTRANPLMRNMPALIEYEIDVDRLRGFGDRVVVAVGVESGDGVAARGGRSVA